MAVFTVILCEESMCVYKFLSVYQVAICDYKESKLTSLEYKFAKNGKLPIKCQIKLSEICKQVCWSLSSFQVEKLPRMSEILNSGGIIHKAHIRIWMFECL